LNRAQYQYGDVTADEVWRLTATEEILAVAGGLNDLTMLVLR